MFGRNGFGMWATAAFAALAIGCSGSEASGPAEAAENLGETRAALSLGFSISFPAGQTPSSTQIVTHDWLRLDDRVTVGEPAGELETVANFGTGFSDLAAGVKINANVHSVGSARMYSAANVRGFLRTSGTVTKQNDVVISGGQFTGVSIPKGSTSWTVEFPNTAGPNVSLEPDRSQTLAPGNFGSLTVKSRSKVYLRTGTYYFTSISTEPQAQLILDKKAGPIFIYVKGSFTYKGGFVDAGGPPANVLVGTLSTSTVYVEAPLLGTIVAPNATVELRRPNNGGIHLGAVFAKRLQLFSDAVFKHAAFDWDFLCALGDTDGDGTLDCFDRCLLDPNKNEPGKCNCGTADTDSDLDGEPDCSDECDYDKNNITIPQCGCANEPGTKPPGTRCNDGDCAGEHTCNGAGVCGNPQECAPGPNCVSGHHGNKTYWFCTGPKTWQSAQTTCGVGFGQALAQADDDSENVFLTSQQSGPAWIGGNDRSAEGAWRWANGSGADGEPFWSGGPSGSVVGLGYANFGAGEPTASDGAHCLRLNGETGQWTDESCSLTSAYICEKPGSRIRLDQPLDDGGPFDPCLFHPSPDCQLGGPDPGVPPDCVPQSTVLPDTLSEFNEQFEACSAVCSGPDDTDCSACEGAASVPPPGSVCSPFAPGFKDACDPINVTATNCVDNAGCAAGYKCLLYFPCHKCQSDGDNCPARCQGELRCAQPDPVCGNEEGLIASPCGEAIVCPDQPEIDGDPYLDPDTQLGPTTFNPSEVFDPTPAPQTSYPSDPPCPGGTSCPRTENHLWCDYTVPKPITPQDTSQPDLHGKSGRGSFIQFDFDPNAAITFDFHPLPLGEGKFDLSAEASFFAAATFTVEPLGSATAEIVDALVKIKADRCSISSEESKFEIFGIDFIDEISTDIKFSKPESAEACNKALADFEEVVSRAKKAMKDAQELVRQYKALAINQTFTTEFCNLVVGDPPPKGFPIHCPATPEQVLNAFIDYYEAQVDALLPEQAKLANGVFTINKDFTLFDGDGDDDGRTRETQRVARAYFPLGPIPMRLEVDAYIDYGLTGTLSFELNPGSVITAKDHARIAYIEANATPSATAGLTLFVGAGFGIPGFEAKAGVQGGISLGVISLPVHAGAGIVGKVEDDKRDPPQEIKEVWAGTFRFQPKQYSLGLEYNYGADIFLNGILGGWLDAKVSVEFLFFSKSWQKRILTFKGFDVGRVPLVNGGGELASTGKFPWGTIQPPMPFVNLERPSGVKTGTPSVPVNTSTVAEFFYDGLCTCSVAGEECARNADCCDDQPICAPRHASPSAPYVTSCGTCLPDGDFCTAKEQCCTGSDPGALGCYRPIVTAGSGYATGSPQCLKCVTRDKPCRVNGPNECCVGSTCQGDQVPDLDGIGTCYQPPK